VRTGLAVLGVCVLAVMVMAGTGAAQPAPVTWRVSIGGETPDHAIQAQDYFPRTVTITAGDTITWTKDTLLPHTVYFLSGTNVPGEVVPQKDGKLLFNPVIMNPQGGKTYDGTGVTASGFMPFQKGLTYSLTFTRSGVYTYICAIHDGMAGAVIVLPRGAKLPSTQAQYDAAGAKQLTQELARGQRLLASAKALMRKTANRAVYVAPLASSPDDHVSLMRYTPDPITVKSGDTVQWDMKDVFEVHTVTFTSGAEVPAFLTPKPQPQGPPMFYYNPRVMAPGGGPSYGGTGYRNSGVMLPPAAPMGPHTYSLTFTKPGTYSYWCVVHVPVGMRGTVVVTP
jgi:plastocyanin